MNFDLSHLAMYYTAASIGVTAAHKICAALHDVVLATPSDKDDRALASIEKFLAFADTALGFFAMRLGKK